MNSTTKHVLIHGLSIALGLITGGATAYFANSPQLASAIGGAAYLGAIGLGYLDPTVPASIPATVTKDDLSDFSKVVTDIVQHRTERLGNDIIPVILDLKDAIKSTMPEPVLTPAPVPASTPATVVPE